MNLGRVSGEEFVTPRANSLLRSSQVLKPKLDLVPLSEISLITHPYVYFLL